MASQSSERLRKKEITEVPKSLKRLSELKPLELAGTCDHDPKSEQQETFVVQIIKAYDGLDTQVGLNEVHKLYLLQPHIRTLCTNQTGSKFL